MKKILLKSLLVFLFLFIIANLANAQCYSATFLVDLGGTVPDSNGRIFVMGNFKSPNGVAGAIRLKKVDGTANKYAITVKDICRDTFDFIFLNGDSSLSSSREVFLNPANQPCLVNDGINNYNRRYTKTSSGNITLAYNFKSCPLILPSSLNTARKVLYESFSSSTLPSSLGQNVKGLSDSIKSRYNNNYTLIHYPMSWPGTGDPYYTSEVNLRNSYYNINSIPLTIVDGKFQINSFWVKYTDTTKVIHTTPGFVKMTTKHAISNKQITVIDSINPSISLTGSNYKLRTAIVERITINNIKTSGEQAFFYVLKKMLPEQVISLNNASVNQVFSRSFSFPGNYRLPTGSSNAISINSEHSVENFNNLLAVTWIQNDESKEIIQSSWSDEDKLVVTDSVICHIGDSVAVYAFGGKIIQGQQILGYNTVWLKPISTTQYEFKSLDGLKTIPFIIYLDDSLNLTPNVTNSNISICGINTSFTIGSSINYNQNKVISWFLNDTLIVNRTLAIDTFRIAGTYKLKVTTFRGCTAQNLFTVSKSNSTFNPNFSSNRQVVTAPPFDFTFANQTQPLNDYNYFWKWGDGITDSTNNQILFKTYSNNGQYTVKLIAQHKVTGCKDSITKLNYISCSGANPQPLSLTTTKNNPSCFGSSNGSIIVNAAGGTLPYQYRVNAGSYQSDNTFSNLLAGIYTIDVKDALNNVVSKKDTLVNPLPISVGGISGLNGVPVSSVQSYNVSSQLGTTYSWSVVNGTLLSGNTTNAIQVQWSAISGIGKVNIGISKNNCTAFDSLLISIGANPLTVLSSKQNESCPGTSNGSISIAAAGGTPPYVYSLNNGFYQTNNIFSNLVGGVYLIQTKDNNQVVAFKYDTITSGVKPVAGIITGPTTVATLAINNYIVGQQTGVNYLWNVTGGVVASGQNTNVVQLAWGAQSMVGKVAVKVTNAGGCSDSSDLNVNIGSVGTNELSISNKVQIYPNPNNGSFAIDVLNSSIEQVDIFNSIGELIWSYTSNETKQSILEVSLKTTPGIYMVSVKTESGVVNQKLILTQ
jgi:hypothetical protein